VVDLLGRPKNRPISSVINSTATLGMIFTIPPETVAVKTTLQACHWPFTLTSIVSSTFGIRGNVKTPRSSVSISLCHWSLVGTGDTTSQIIRGVKFSYGPPVATDEEHVEDGLISRNAA